MHHKFSRIRLADPQVVSRDVLRKQSRKQSCKRLLSRRIVAFVFAILPAAQLVAQEKPVEQAEPSAIVAAELGETKNVHRLGELFFAGQFKPTDIEQLKAAKITRVISLRRPEELTWDEAKLLADNGIEFKSLPFASPETLTDDVFDQVRELLQDQSNPTLFHCGSANRVGGAWLPFRVLDQGVELETALAEAAEIGLRAPYVRERALDYIKRQQGKQMGAESKADSESVKPGINDSFLDPELNVESYIDRFEVESREIYSSRDKIVAATGIKQGDSVADVGAGTGLFTRLFAEKVGSEGWVYAVDIAPKFLEHINASLAKQEIENVTGVLCSDKSSRLPANSVDVVFICDTYHHFEFPAKTMGSIHRALKPGGQLIVIDFERIPGKSRDWLMGHVRAGKEVFRAEIQDAGFTLIDELQIEGFEENYFLKFRKN